MHDVGSEGSQHSRHPAGLKIYDMAVHPPQKKNTSLKAVEKFSKYKDFEI